jgi:hypothetical protein
MRITLAILGLARITVAMSGQGHINPSTTEHGYSEPITLDEILHIKYELLKKDTRYDLTFEVSMLLKPFYGQDPSKVFEAFEALSEDEKIRLGAELRAEFSKIESDADELRSDMEEKILDIQQSYADQLLDLEKEMLGRVDYPHLNMRLFLFWEGALDSIYTATPQCSEVTKEEVEKMIWQNDEDEEGYFKEPVLEYVRNHYDELTPAQRKRVKGWFEFIYRTIEEAKITGVEV